MSQKIGENLLTPTSFHTKLLQVPAFAIPDLAYCCAIIQCSCFGGEKYESTPELMQKESVHSLHRPKLVCQWGYSTNVQK